MREIKKENPLNIDLQLKLCKEVIFREKLFQQMVYTMCNVQCYFKLGISLGFIIKLCMWNIRNNNIKQYHCAHTKTLMIDRCRMWTLIIIITTQYRL